MRDQSFFGSLHGVDAAIVSRFARSRSELHGFRSCMAEVRCQPSVCKHDLSTCRLEEVTVRTADAAQPAAAATVEMG